MNHIRKFMQASLITLSSAYLVGCANIPLQPGAEKVIVITKSAPVQCRLLGTVSSYEANGRTVPFVSQETLETRQHNLIRNRARAEGGNVIALTREEIKYTHSLAHRPDQPRSNSTVNTIVASHFIAGKVYLCPSSVTKKLISVVK